jgi:hypothetical protein
LGFEVGFGTTNNFVDLVRLTYIAGKFVGAVAH